MTMKSTQYGLALGRARGEKGRERVLTEFERTRADLILVLRRRASELWEQYKRPISTNDLRYLLKANDYQGDRRVLAAAFPRGAWVPVSYIRTNSEDANARDVRGFVPKGVSWRNP